MLKYCKEQEQENDSEDIEQEDIALSIMYNGTVDVNRARSRWGWSQPFDIPSTVGQGTERNEEGSKEKNGYRIFGGLHPLRVTAWGKAHDLQFTARILGRAVIDFANQTEFSTEQQE